MIKKLLSVNILAEKGSVLNETQFFYIVWKNELLEE